MAKRTVTIFARNIRSVVTRVERPSQRSRGARPKAAYENSVPPPSVLNIRAIYWSASRTDDVSPETSEMYRQGGRAARDAKTRNFCTPRLVCRSAERATKAAILTRF